MYCSSERHGSVTQRRSVMSKKGISCTPPYKCQDSHTSDVLPIRQSIIRNMRAERLFALRINDIHTPFRHFELVSTRLTFRQPSLPRQVPAKLSKHPRTPTRWHLWTILYFRVSRPSFYMFRASGSSSSGVHFFTVHGASGILCNLLLYSTRSLTWTPDDELPEARNM